MSDASTETTQDTKVVIVGGGPAGLTAAFELLRSGIKPVVLEAHSQVGGISQTVEREGWRFDIGGHRFFTKVTRVRDFWHEILSPEDFPTRNRLSRIYYSGKFFDYPIKPVDALLNLGFFESLRCVGSYVRTRLFPPRDQSDFENWVAARFGWRLYRIFFKTYTEKVWGVPATEIRSDWAAQRIKTLSLPSAVFHALVTSFRPTKHTSLIDRFEYPRLGPGMMWEVTTDLVNEAGGEVRLNTKVVALERNDAGVQVAITEGDRGREKLHVDELISSMPLSELVLSMSPPAPDEVINAAKSLNYRDFLTVALVVPEAQSFPDNWIYVHDPSVRLGRVQNFRAWSPDMVKPGSTCLGLEYFVFENDDLWNTPDDELIKLATEEITRIGLIPAGVVQAGYVVRIPKAYPVYDANYAEHVDTIRRWLESATPNVHPVGRNGMHRYNNQDHSMMTAMLTVENILGASHDIWAVNVEDEYHEAGEYDDTRPNSTVLDGVSGSGRSAPLPIDRDQVTKTAPTKPGLSDRLVGLSRTSASARNFFRWGWRTSLDARARARVLKRLVSPSALAERPGAQRAGWTIYRWAFSLSKIGWLRTIQFRLRERASVGRKKTVALDHLLVGGWNGMSARRFAEVSGLVLDPSTRLEDSAQVDLLRRYDALGDRIYDADELIDTPYVRRIKVAAAVSGHHRGAKTDEELIQVAREVVDRYRNLDIPYRPGRSSGATTPRVRRIDRSDYYEIRDGHHRLAIACARGEKEAEVVVERPKSTTPLQQLLRKMSWLDGQVRLYQPVSSPEVSTWPLMRQCTDRLDMMREFLGKFYADAPEAERSYLDVGACYGWFVSAMQLEGYDAHGIERDPLAATLAPLVYGLDPKRIAIGDGVAFLAQTAQPYNVVSCFSVLHHFVLGRGTTSPEELARLLDEATGDVLFLDTGEAHESWFKLVLPHWTADYVQRWLLEHTTFTNVVALGTDRDGVGAFAGKYGRTLFACTR